MEQIIRGILAGALATVPMSIVMFAGKKLLPRGQRYSLPPHEITGKLLEKAGAEDARGTAAHGALTTAAHFGYGSLMGALYAELPQNVRRHPIASGCAFGSAVWLGSYLGLLPSLRILKPATKHPPERNQLMIGAHLIWGSTLGLAARGA